MSDQHEDKKLSVPKFSSFSSRQPGSGITKHDRNPEASRLSVPKFGSFKDRDSTAAKETTREGDRLHRLIHRSRSDRDHERRRDHKSSRRRSRSRSPRGSRSSKHEALTVARQDNPKEPSPSSLYFLDLKGDPLITRYGGINKSEIPAYYRSGKGKILGAHGRLLIHRDGARDQFSVIQPGEEPWTSRDRTGLRSRIAWAKHPSISIRPRKLQLEDSEDFISINRSKKRKRGQEDVVASSDDEQPNYRSIQGKAKARSGFESETDEYSSVDDLVEMPSNTPARSKAMDLEKRVKDHPENIDAWLELVDHQDVLLRVGEAPGEHTSENVARSYTEIKVSMLESALAHASQATDRGRVVTRLMSEGIKVWSVKKATRKWAEYRVEKQHNFMLWKTHLDYAMSNIGIFQYDSVKEMLLERLRKSVEEKDNPESMSEAIYVFARATRFIHDTGYRELAVAAWQALIELNMFDSTIREEEKLAAFEEFWESEAPRLGDVDARGWHYYVHAGAHQEGITKAPAGSGPSPSSKDPYKAWGITETRKAEQAQLPARTMDEGNEDDPYRIVVYPDIEPWLFVIPKQDLSRVKHQLIDGFLLFCGLPPLCRTDEWIRGMSADQFIVRISMNTKQAPEEGQDNLDNSEKKMALERANIEAEPSTDLLFDTKTWFTMISARTSLPMDLTWASHALKQLVYHAKEETLGLYYLALCFTIEPASIKKPARSLLKQYSGNVELYQAYALAECSNGNLEVANKVLESATGMLTTVNEAEKLRLWNTWAYLDLVSGHKDKATMRLCVTSDEKPAARLEGEVPQSAVLKACKKFRDCFFEQISKNRPMEAATYGESVILLDYLTADDYLESASAKQGNISGAMAQADGIIKMMSRRGLGHSVYLERVLQFAAKLLHLHATKGPFRRVFLREQASKFLEHFPKNTILLALYEWADSSLRVVDDTRTILKDKVLIPSLDCVNSRVFAIQHELDHGTVHSTGNAFEQALRSDSCKASPGLWVWHIRYCASEKELRRKAKDVFYRALGYCPWSREVMMEAFVTLSSLMESSELKSVYDTMLSKGVRIHVDLEEALKR